MPEQMEEQQLRKMSSACLFEQLDLMYCVSSDGPLAVRHMMQPLRANHRVSNVLLARLTLASVEK
ncbi:hypothetical protein ColTof4_00915 [Colletotrichum tofieldiae]|nr:hypothetical protein ColTof3_08135 [Colletotrichum tofieldiae]GKT68492.1 hypothetical protein ColTof4_00915 [Colletotrichum tofieldiae]GKT90485.1 hypothetical protein Ct61P_08335 [Colletotrichum tofieldiae]